MHTPDIEQAQNVVKNFVRSLVKGLPVCLLSVCGGTAECTAFLDRQLTTLELARKGSSTSPSGPTRGSESELSRKRHIRLEEIVEVIVGESGGKDFQLFTDNFCVTLVLGNGQAVGFKFMDEEERDTFALCLSMFVDSRRMNVPKMYNAQGEPTSFSY